VTRRRRAALLLGLALVLGALAASDVGRREAALRAELGAPVDVVVARRALPAGRRLRLADLATKRIPARYAPADGVVYAGALAGRRLSVPVPAGGALSPELLASPTARTGPALRRGERAAEVLATGDPTAVVPGARVDVLVTREGAEGAAGETRLALEDVEVLAAAPAAAADDDRTPVAGPRVDATLRVTLRQAVYLAAAQAFARDIRLLARPPDDGRHTGEITSGGAP
jgi:pilus assembly protein CpaB